MAIGEQIVRLGERDDSANKTVSESDTFVAVCFAVQPMIEPQPACFGAVAGLVGIECGVVSGVINLESSGVEASDWRPRHDEHYHEV